MKKLTEEFTKQYIELKEDLIKMVLKADVFENMSTEEFDLLQRGIRFINTAFETTIKQAMMIDEMNTKLDKLLNKPEGT